ncbi:UNVERIFIED_CONTAM: DUF2218 domain-containing protein [Kocuria sp. CPCC 205316]|uniref:DUF2218 domain-containing protein n=1 Tax=Kocuria TaxID=57493 RepID=UPI0036DBBCA5
MTEPLVHPAATAYRAHATVVTEAAARYAKQLASHLGRKAEIRDEAEGSRVVLTVGSCLLVAGAHALQLRAESGAADGLEWVQQVIGSHLERFGQREGLTVAWSAGG